MYNTSIEFKLSCSGLYSICFIDREADMGTDDISIITESVGADELEQTLSLVESKEKKYLHHPNTYLNARLNVLLVISFAAVTGLGIGHFLGNAENHNLCTGNFMCFFICSHI
jgi:hypothetical protein